MFNKTIITSLALALYAAAAAASIVDAPHNGINEVNCSSCHSYSLWWQYSPVSRGTVANNDKVVNLVCNKCHDGSKAQVPLQRTHASAVIGSTTHGSWQSDCVDCHDPHYQGQLAWVNQEAQTYPAGLYLVSGTIATVSAGTVAGTTNLAYSNVPPDNQSGNWTDRSRWGKKNNNPDMDRGTILVVNTGKAENTYQVISANDSVITVKGTVSPADTGKSFGLIYGQLIKKVISTPLSGDRQVAFFDPDTLYNQGGFTDQETPRQGICQVCHTTTNHWTQDAAKDGHNATMKCTNCHDMAQGFKPNLPAHSFLTNTTPCTNCHQHPANDPMAIHRGVCQTCHTTPPALRTDSGNFQHVTRIGLDPAGAPLANGKTATDCTYCHSLYFPGHTHSHSASVSANVAQTPLTANCQGCHPASAAPFIAAGQVHATAGCATCHDLSTNGALKGSAATATAPYGECITCHAGYFASHQHGVNGGSLAHALSLGSDTHNGQSCSVCHNTSLASLATWSAILAEHKNDCGLCHNSTRSTNLRAPYTSVADVIAVADSLHPVTCLDCHATHGNDHQTLYVSAYEDGGQPSPQVLTTCTVNCHTPTFGTNAADPKQHDSCTTCHTGTATPVTLIGHATGHTVPEANPFNNCYTCHGAGYFDSHSNVNHNAKVRPTSDNTCERCHSGDAITSTTTHKGLCALCHDPARGGVLTSLAASGPGTCNTCHGSNWLTIHTPASAVPHNLTVAMTTACSACHASTAGTLAGIAVDPADNTVHDSCATCHDAAGLLIGLASGHGGAAECATCHGGFGSGNHTAVDHTARVSMALGCSACHAGAEGSLSGVPVSANPKQHTACASCHGLSGALSGSATGKNGSNNCESCHGLFAAKHNGQNHAALVAMALDCSGCHAGAQGTASGMSVDPADPKKHSYCSACHDSSGALAGLAAGKGGGADCNSCHGLFASKHASRSHAASVSMSPDCLTCHSSAAGTATGIITSVADNTVHDTCAQCHGADGVLIGSATGHGALNACVDCHAIIPQHQASHFIQINETLDRGLATNQPCNACHGVDGPDAGTAVLDAWDETLAMHGDNGCAMCHASSREVIDNQGNSQVPPKTVPDIISAASNPTHCLACHLDKQQPVTHGFDHNAAGIITGLERCVSCHGNPNLLVGIHATNGCKTCHDKTTAPVILKGSAVGHGKAAVISAGVPNTCGSCHGTHAANFLNHAAPDHVAQGFVTSTANGTCDNCHLAADTINDSAMHQGNCALCHVAAPGAATDGTLTGSAAGKQGGGPCTTCHTLGWLAIHQGASPAVGHLTQVGMALSCSSCHNGAAGTAAGIALDIANPLLHRACTSCHDANGNLTSLATGNLGPNTCTDCHGAFSSQHAATDHSTRVAMANDCSGCHTASGNTVDPNDPKVHDACATCHSADGTLTGLASSHPGGGDCNTCHGSFTTVHATKSHSSLVTLSTDCSGCHDSAQGTASGLPVGASTLRHASCASCHGSTGALISIATGNGGGAQCNTCHGLFSAKHAATDHSFRVALAANCADCHSGSQGNATGIPLSLSDNKVHDACSQCHGATGVLTGSAAGKTFATALAPNDCATCHGGFTNNHTATVNHDAMVGMHANCAGCHSASGSTVIPGDPKAHQACTSCHAANGRLLGVAIGHDGATLGGQDGGGDCAVCHGGFTSNHASVNHASRVAMATDCSGCHSAVGNTVDPADPKVHDACATCHNANGTLAGSASGHPGGGTCNTCHGGFATIHASKNHGSQISLSTDCSGCHDGAQGTASGMPVGGSAMQHASCASCHGSTGALVSIAIGQGGGAQCDTCHGVFASTHGTADHSFRVALASNCADCHGGTQGNATGIPLSLADNKMHDTCSQCHGATGALTGSAAGKTGSTALAPNDCATCHGGFTNNHAAVGHNAMVSMNANCAGCHSAIGNTVLPGNPKAHQACASCHAANGRLTGVAMGHDGATLGGQDGGGDCAVCHGAFVDNHASVDHASRVAMATECSGCHSAVGNTVDPLDPKVHDACATCHNANGSLAGSASGHPGGGTCHTCHGNFTTIHATKNHSSQISLSIDCSGCHDGAQGTASGMPVGGSSMRHASCASCHGSTGALVSIATGHGGGAQCNSCHGLFSAKHSSTDHAFRVALAANCADCHSATPGTALGIPLSLVDNKIHDACSQCHGATGVLSGSAAGKTGSTALAPNDCATCHGGFSNNHATTVTHSTTVSMQVNCAGCHSAIGNTVLPGDPKAHQACASCHEANGRLRGHAAGKDGATLGGQDGGGDCTVCHGTFIDNHATVDHASRVAMATDCSGCHSAVGNTVNPADPKVHDACATCHNANGALTGSASGHLGGGTCNTCHNSFAAIHASRNHSALVSLSTDCSGCHGGAQGTASGMPVGGSAMQHTSCASCHGSTGALVSIATGHGGGAQCNSCHGLFNATHSTTDHAFRVALATNCADCHTGAQGNAAGLPLNLADNKIHDTCGQCHGATGILTGSAAGKTGATALAPNDCSTCHGGFTNNHTLTVNHSATVSMNANCTTCHTASGSTVIPGDPKAHQACASCHDVNGRLLGAAIGHDGATLGGQDGGGNCSVCHGAFGDNHAGVNHASRVSMATDCSGCHTAIGNTVDPLDPKVHDACASCHNANGSLTGSASGHLGGGTCHTCHASFATIHATRNHSSQVSLSTDCSGCHNGAQGTITGMPVGGSAMQHTSCASCHGSTGSLISIATGRGGGAQCNTCHGLFSAKHSATDHSFRVALTTNCADCHSGTEGTLNGLPVNPTDPEKHQACADCHGATGVLTGSAAGKEGATALSPNTCQTCHGLFTDRHAGVDHSTMVRLDSNEHCSGCHTATGNMVNPADPRIHDACATCHGPDGRLVNLASGHDGGTIGGADGGGDCIVCHGEYLPNHQSVTPQSSNHDHRSLYYGGGLVCSSCHSSDSMILGSVGSGQLVTQNDVNSLHSRPTGDGCALCHYYDINTQANPQGLPLWDTIRTAIINGTNGILDATCVVCHDYNATGAGHFASSGNLAPAFTPSTFSKPNGAIGIPYAGHSLAGAAIDPEGDAITYSKVSGPAWLSVAPDGTLSGTPTLAETDSFVVAAAATGGTGYATMTITVVIPGNQPPAFTQVNFSTANANEASAYSGQSIAGSATDPEGDPLTYAKVNGPAWLTVAPDGALGGTPDIAGNQSFVVRVTATGGSDEATLSITVIPLNSPPAFTPATFSLPDATLNIAYTGQSISGTALDPEGDAITYSKVSGPAWLSVAADGTLSGTPTTTRGANNFVVRATATGGSADATLTITVLSLPPVFSPSSFGKPNATATLAYSGQSLALSATDPEGDTITYSKVGGPAWLTVAADGTLGGTPPAAGTDVFTVQAAADGGTATGTLTIVVNPPPTMLMKKGSFQKNTVTGAQAIGGLGFQPKAIVFYWTTQASEGYAASLSIGQGFAADNGASITMAANVMKATDARTTIPDGDGFQANNLAIAMIIAGTANTTATAAEATVTAMGADGFTLNWSKASATADIIHYMALGGTSLTNANVGTTAMLGSAGTPSSVTGVGFMPDAVMLMTGARGVAINNFGANSRVGLNLGFIVGGAAPQAMSLGMSVRGSATTLTATQGSVLHSAQALTPMYANTVSANVAFTSMNADGFTLTPATTSGTHNVAWLALKGGKYDIGVFNQPIAAGTQYITSIPFQPKGVFFASTNSTNANGTIDQTAPGASIAVGSAQSPTAQGAVWSHNLSTATSDANMSTLTSKAIRLAQSNGTATPTTSAEAGLSSFTANGFSLNWTSADATPRRIIYFAVGD